jgi:GntR family transcriptional regulator/MocR family aminotransferase
MISFKPLIQLDREADLPIFLQLHNALVKLIKSGILKGGAKLPGTRGLAEQLTLHRKTVIAAYDELLSQGWTESIPSKGTFVSNKLPEIQPVGNATDGRHQANAGFNFDPQLNLHRHYPAKKQQLILDEGIPDVRIAPMTEILRHYRGIISRSYNAKHLAYGSFYGDESLRITLANYLQETRGIACTPENVMITRGSQMGMYLSSQLIHKSGGYSVVGNTNYIAANLTLEDAGAKLLFASVDDKGLVTADIEAFCKVYNVKSVFVTSHHHHPTTVTLSPERRVHLVELAREYGFAILEDDYDYDFHYQRSPLLPLASTDAGNHVVYMGAMCKIVAPAIRVGYLVGPKDFIEAAGHFRRIIDRQGDAIMERAIALMIEQGDLQRHIRKALKTYQERRDHFYQLLQTHLSPYLEFQLPEGGMAFWAILRKDLNWDKVAQRCLEKGLIIPDYVNYDPYNAGHNGIRMGFAALNKEEQTEVVLILKACLEKISAN